MCFTSAPSEGLPESSLPIHRLPSEVLARIFAICGENEQPHQWFAPVTTPTAELSSILVANGPWNIAQVCRTWRNAATLTRLLWANVVVQAGLPDKTGVSARSGMKRIRAGLEISGIVPLSISSIGAGTFSLCAAIFMEHASHLRFLNLSDNFHSLSQDLIFPLKQHFPILKTLELRNTSLGGTTYMALFDENTTPQLRSITFHSVVCPFDGGICGIPWGQIDHLGFTFSSNPMNLDSLLEILDNADHLRSLDVLTFSALLVNSTRLIRHASLSKLSLGKIITVLQCFSLPVLRELSVAVHPTPPTREGDYYTSSFAVLSQFFERSDCRLETLQIEFTEETVPMPELHAFREAIAVIKDSLTSLRIRWTWLSGSLTFFNHLVKDIRENDWLPRLSTLMLEFQDRPYGESENIVDFISTSLICMLQRRSTSRPGIDAIRRFTFRSNEILYDVERMMDGDGYIPGGVRQAYQELKDGGMELFILKGMLPSYGLESYRYTEISRTRVLALLR
jgi:hypothetical protein